MPLIPGIHVLDITQSVVDAALVARWLEALTDAGPDDVYRWRHVHHTRCTLGDAGACALCAVIVDN